MTEVFTRRDLIATASVHLLLVALATGLWLLERTFTPEALRSDIITIAALAICVVTAAVAVGFSVQAWRHSSPISSTSLWDPATCLVQLAAAVTLVYSLGGFAGAGWALVLLLVPYFGVVFAAEQLRLLAVAMGASLLVIGWFSGTFADAHLPTAVAVICLVVLTTWFTEQSATYMFDMRRQAQRRQAAMESRVDELSDALADAARGDLTGHVLTKSRGEEPTVDSNEKLESLARSFDETVESLRGLVGSVRVGGESIGSAASQVLVAAREQAASASEQSSAVAETTATIEELAATAAQIAETSGQVAVFASETLGFAEAGRWRWRRRLRRWIRLRCGWIRLRCGRWGWGRRVRRLVGFWW